MGDELESGDYDKDLADKEATKEDILAKKQEARFYCGPNMLRPALSTMTPHCTG